MHQFVLWTALETEGFGANLQHVRLILFRILFTFLTTYQYNPVVDQKAQNHWGIPLDWSLKAQLVFGGRAGEPGEKAFEPLEKRVFVHGK
jgi:predicted oxidoreductase (fatty acid repression mutant protein)